MNQLTIIGNLTRDPELRTTQSGVDVCSFTVAVNRHVKEGDKADYFRVTAWRELAQNCHKYLLKGRKVAVTGPVSVSTYQSSDGSTRANMEVQAQSVEFLTPKGESTQTATPKAQPHGYEEVADDDLPF